VCVCVLGFNTGMCVFVCWVLILECVLGFNTGMCVFVCWVLNYFKIMILFISRAQFV